MQLAILNHEKLSDKIYITDYINHKKRHYYQLPAQTVDGNLSVPLTLNEMTKIIKNKIKPKLSSNKKGKVSISGLFTPKM